MISRTHNHCFSLNSAQAFRFPPLHRHGANLTTLPVHFWITLSTPSIPSTPKTTSAPRIPSTPKTPNTPSTPSALSTQGRRYSSPRKRLSRKVFMDLAWFVWVDIFMGYAYQHFRGQNKMAFTLWKSWFHDRVFAEKCDSGRDLRIGPLSAYSWVGNMLMFLLRVFYEIQGNRFGIAARSFSKHLFLLSTLFFNYCSGGWPSGLRGALKIRIRRMRRTRSSSDGVF